MFKLSGCIAMGVLAILSLTAGNCSDGSIESALEAGGDDSESGDAGSDFQMEGESLTGVSNRQFVVTETVEGGEVTSAVEDGVVALSFGDEGDMALYAGSTWGFGEYTATERTLQVEIPEVIHPAGLYPWENAEHEEWFFVDAITHITKASLAENRLVIDAALSDGTAVQLELMDRTVLDPYGVMGSPWMIENLIDDGVMSEKLESPDVYAYIIMYENTRVVFGTGCKEGNSTFTASDNIISIDFPVTYRDAVCEDDAGEAMEAHVLSVLSQSPSFKLEEDGLYLILTAGDKGLRFKRGHFQ